MSSPRRNGLSRHGSKKDDKSHLNDLQYEGTIVDGSLSPRGGSVSKSRRGGSLKERKVGKTEEEADKMRRCNSTKERRRAYSFHQKDDTSTKHSHDTTQPLSRKNSTETKSSKSTDQGSQSQKLSRESKPDVDGAVNSKELFSEKWSAEESITKPIIKEKHNRHGSLKERGELKSKSGGKKRFSGLQKVIDAAVGTRKPFKREKSFSTDSLNVGSPENSPLSKDKQFNF